MSNESKNDEAWKKLFDSLPILDKVDKSGFFEISATAINKYREARLMTKFDHALQRPGIFKDNDLTIQPITRGSYVIGRFDSYHSLPSDENIPIETIPFPHEIETIDPENLYSESSALLCAYNTKIMREVLEEEISLTVLGRMSTGLFDYSIDDNREDKKHRIKVINSQLEIDSGFEGEESFAIIEAKNATVSDFLIRQIYYPYRLWTGKTRKEVIPVFMFYSNDVFSFYVFKFNQVDHYNSLELVRQKRFQIVPREIELADVLAALDKAEVTPEPENCNFPQADKFEKVVDILTRLYGSSNNLTQDFITSYQDFDVRQTQYYTGAAAYLGLVERKQDKEQGVYYGLTAKGLSIMARKPQARNLALVECIFQRNVFNQVFRLYTQQGSRPTPDQVIEIMRAANLGLDQDGTSTIPRRARTVLGWIDWIVMLTRK
jgi:hypothetical protein